MSATPHVLIVGSGIVGASIAWHVARAGARVTVLDADAPGGVATRHSWAWINASWGNPEPYFRLRVQAMQEWRRLEQEVATLRVGWPGSLFWDLPPAQLEAFRRQHAEWGYPIRTVTRAEIARLEPALAAPPEVALHAASEGVVEPLAAAQALLAAARDNGADVMADTEARALILSAGRVTGVETAAGRIAADEVIVAAGVGTARVLATAGLTLPLLHAPGIVVASAPHRKCLNGLLAAPEMELRQTAEGRFLAVGRFEETEADPDGAQAAAALFATMTAMLATDAPIRPGTHAIAYRPMPGDRFPAVGRADGIAGLYAAVTHSGVTLAPALGRFVAEEVLYGRRDRLLAPYEVRRLL
jgi:glycine/D-amino acid oxidase-like deaminating enzyme